MAPPQLQQFLRKRSTTHVFFRRSDDLPVEEIVLEPEGDPERLVCIGQEVTDTLDCRPGKLAIIRRRQPMKHSWTGSATHKPIISAKG